MPSHIHQELRVLWNRKKKKTGKGIWIAKKTGYVNVWINGKHYYYDEAKQYDSPDEIDMVSAFQPVPKSTAKKGKIVVKKKK